jgi:uncharacterized protein (TIGR02118 family)
MLKFVVVVSRRSDLTFAEFRDYFQRVHGPLAEKLPGLRRYVRSYPVADPQRQPPNWDCIAELYFDDREAMEAAWLTLAGQQADEDLKEFADLTRTSWSIVEEDVIR